MSQTEKVGPGSDDNSPYSKITTSPIEGNKQRNDPFSVYGKRRRVPFLFALLSFFQQCLSPVLSRAKSFQSSEPLKSILITLSSFRKLLTELAEKDLSHQTDFNYQMAKLWHILREDCNNLPPNLSSPLVLERIKFLIQQIENFPTGSDYSLGYYLSHDIGQGWNPVPCMNFLQELHEEFIQSPLHSTLHNWILLIDDLLISVGELSHK